MGSLASGNECVGVGASHMASSSSSGDGGGMDQAP